MHEIILIKDDEKNSRCKRMRTKSNINVHVPIVSFIFDLLKICFLLTTKSEVRCENEIRGMEYSL